MRRTTATDQRTRTLTRCHAVTAAGKELCTAVAELWLVVGDLDQLEAVDAEGIAQDAPTLKAIAERIEACMYHFDQVQTAAGLRHPQEPRYRQFLRGQLNDESEMA
jgi:hypothetical protein